MNLTSINLQCSDIKMMWQWAASGTSSQPFVFCMVCVYKHVSIIRDPNRPHLC